MSKTEKLVPVAAATTCSPIFDTPETNRACCYVYSNDGPEHRNVAVWLRPWVKAEHSRKLERERDQFKNALMEIAKQHLSVEMDEQGADDRPGEAPQFRFNF